MCRKEQVFCSSCPNSCFMHEIDDQELFKSVNARKVMNFYKKGQQIIFEDMPADTIGFIYSGKVKVYKEGPYGRCQILRFSKRGDILGHRGLNCDYYPISASALEDTAVCIFPRRFFLDLIFNIPRLNYKLLMFFSDELLNTEIHERNLAHMSVREKIADALLYVLKQYGVDGSGCLDIDLSRQEIADFAGTTKEQVSKALSEFKADGIIDLDKKRIILKDPASLEAVISHTSPVNYK